MAQLLVLIPSVPETYKPSDLNFSTISVWDSHFQIILFFFNRCSITAKKQNPVTVQLS